MRDLTFSREFVVFLGLEQGWSGWVALSLVAFAIVISSWPRPARPFSAYRIMTTLLRLSGLLVLAVMVLQPAVRTQEVVRKRAHLVFLIDCSRSMSVQDGDENRTRAQKTGRLVQANKETLDKLGTAFDLDFFCFGARARPISRSEAAAGPKPVEPQTDIGAALNDVAGTIPKEDMAAVVLISDGRNRSDTLVRPPPGVPVHTIVPAATGELHDLAVSSVRADDFAFVRNKTRVKAIISSSGMNVDSIPVTLLKNGSPVSTKSISIHAGEAVTVELEFTPTRVGKAALSVTVPDLPGDALKDNNRLDFRLDVLRDRIRVLHVAGRPSWDVRFLRELLKRDPSVDLISFFILRTPGDLAVGRNDELSLIRFPVQELFSGTLDTFDLVVFQNFTYRGYQMRPYLKNIRDHVLEGGGAFMMIGGEQSFSQGGYAGTYIEDILPVNLSERSGSDSATFRPKLTKSGVYHPVSSLGATPAANKALWSRLPLLPGCNTGLQAKPGATVLAVHPVLKSPDGSALPVLSVADAGKGRSMAVAWDGSWRWRFSSHATEASARAYRRFFRGAMRWLVRDPSVAPVRFIKGGGRQSGFGPLDVIIKVMRPDYEPAKGSNVRLVMESQASNSVPVSLHAVTDEAGLVRFSIPLPGKGAYRLTAEATYEGMPLGRAMDVAVIGGADPELLQPGIDEAFMRKLARDTGGTFHVSPLDISKLGIKDPKPLQVTGQTDEPLWNKWWLALIAVAAFCIEWFSRRRIGLA